MSERKMAHAPHCACGVGDAGDRKATGVDPEIKTRSLQRLRRIEGQVRGLQRMIEDDTYCIDVLHQVSAATKALQSVAMGLVDEHLRHCVADAAAGGDPERKEHMLAEATKAIERLVKS